MSLAKVKVGIGRGKLGFAEAIAHAAPGDLVVIDPGRYDAGTATLRGIGLQGAGEQAAQVHLDGVFLVEGHCTFTNLTVEAPPYKNAVSVQSAHNMATLSNCLVLGDPGAKYPTMWCDGGTLVLHQATVTSDAQQDAIQVVAGGKLHATGSRLGSVSVSAAQADLIDSETSSLLAQRGARVTAYGRHQCSPATGKRAFRALDRSVCHFTHLALPDGYQEGLADDSVVQIDAVSQPEGDSFTVLTAGDARVRTSSPRIDVHEKRAESLSTEVPPATPDAAPKTVHWPIASARELSTKIAPQINAGDTVVLDPGDYFLEDYADHFLLLNATLVGAGAGETRLHGTVGAMESGSVTLRNLTIQAASADAPAVHVSQQGGRLSLDQVSLVSAPGSTIATLYAEAGHVEMTRSAIVGGPERRDGTIVIDGAASFSAQHSTLGWLRTQNGGSTTLTDCTSYSLESISGGRIEFGDRHRIRANTINQYELSIEPDGLISGTTLITDFDGCCLRLEGGALDLAEFVDERAESGAVLTVHRESGEVRGLDTGAFALWERSEDGELVHVSQSDDAHAPAAQVAGALSSPATNDAFDLDAAGPDRSGDARGSSPDVAPGSPQSDPLAELHALVGLEMVKQQVQSFVNTVRMRQKRAELGLPTDTGFTLHSMFLGNPGTGKTTVARLIGAAMHHAGVVENDSFVEAGRAQLVSENIGGTAKQTRSVLESGRGGVIFIDEAYALASEDSAGFSDEAVTEILTFMENHRSDTMVILAGYNDKMHDLLAMNEGLKSRIKHRFDFKDYTLEEIGDIGLAELASGQYIVNEPLYRRIIGTAYAQSSDSSNARWARNFNQDLRAKLEERIVQLEHPTREDLTVIQDADLHALGGAPVDRETQLAAKLSELDAMVGLAPVKTWVRSLIDQATVNQRLVELDGSRQRPNYHMAFTGSMGTGKTTVARIIAEIFHLLGILSVPTVKTVSSSQLLGKYIGHSSDETHRAFDAAMGGVLFIDEAHQLDVEDGANNQLKQEVVNAMITRLEDDRDKFVAVFAGYTEQMHAFFASDPGLKSRIPREIEFPDYSAREVAEITGAILRQNWTFDGDLLAEVVIEIYDLLPASERENGRWARNFSERIVTAHNRHLVEHDVHGEAMRAIPDSVLRGFLPDAPDADRVASAQR